MSSLYLIYFGISLHLFSLSSSLIYFWQIWDVLSNKEVVDIIAAAPGRSSAARALVESAVRAWRYKYPTSKVDDCAAVCLFIDSDSPKLSSASHINSKEQSSSGNRVIPDGGEDLSGPTVLKRSGTCRASNEESQEEGNEEASKEEEIDAEVDREWSALEGVSRVNTLLNLPRFVPGEEDKAAAGMRKRK